MGLEASTVGLSPDLEEMDRALVVTVVFTVVYTSSRTRHLYVSAPAHKHNKKGKSLRFPRDLCAA
jgi:hypothetical protein